MSRKCLIFHDITVTQILTTHLCPESSIPPPTPPDYSADCKTGYVLYRTNCYRVINEIQTWAGSQSICQQDGANLISIMDPYELAFTTVLLGNATGQQEFWTGGKLFQVTIFT